MVRGPEVEVVGLPVVHGYRAGLAELVQTSEWGPGSSSAPSQHVTVPLGEHESIACVQSGVWLARDDEGPLVVMLTSHDHGMGEASRSRSWPPTASAVSACSPSSGR